MTASITTSSKTRYVPMRGDEPLGPAMSRTAAIKVLYTVVNAWRDRNRFNPARPFERNRCTAPKDYRRIDRHTLDTRFPEWELRQDGRYVARVYLRAEDESHG